MHPLPPCCGIDCTHPPALGNLRGRSVLVLGAGLVGLSAVAIAADRGARVTVVEPAVARHRCAREFGAAEVFASVADAGVFDGVVEASGSAAAVSAALAVADVDGTVALVGSVSPGPNVALVPERVVRQHLTIRGIHNSTPEHLAAAAAWLAARPDVDRFAALVSHQEALCALDAAIEAAPTHVRVGVRP